MEYLRAKQRRVSLAGANLWLKMRLFVRFPKFNLVK